MPYTFRIGCVVALLLTTFTKTNIAQSTTEEYQVKAVFLYNFSRFVDWPENSFNSPNAPFVVGVIGGDPFGYFLEETVKGEVVHNHVMTIHHFQDLSEIDNCHILYINYKDPDQIKKTLDAVNGKNILTVNDNSNFVRMGGMIQFYTEMNKIKLMINSAAIKQSQLEISSKLMRVAKVY
jgi:hypothetical protein